MVVGDHEDVAALSGDARHLVALGGIPVAVGAEDHDGAARGELTDGGQGVLEGVGAVAEVDVDAGAAVARDPLGAAGQVGVDAAVGSSTASAPIASSSKPASTSMTIARAALAAMCQPISGSRVTSERPSGPVSRNSV